MKKMSKNDIILALILILNIVFITIPYNFKNMNLKEDLKILKSSSNAKTNKSKTDFYMIYSQFDEILNERDMQVINKKADFSSNSLEIMIVFETDIQKISNFLVYLKRKMPNLKIISSNIDISKDKNSEIIFYIED